jgi:hypothetical protein
MSEYSKLWDNGCHTIGRETCYLNQDKLYVVLNKIFRLKNTHFFNNAVPCAKGVFNNVDPNFPDRVTGNRSAELKKLAYLE